jgi:hypothetical protein
MALRIAGLSVPGPSETLSAARSLLGLPGRIGRLVGEVEALLARIEAVVDSASRAAGTAQHVADQASRIVDAYAPLAAKAAPFAEQFVGELSEHEVSAAVKLVDLLPTLSTYMERDIVPALGQIGPDIHLMTQISRDVQEAIHGIPGFRLFERRGERKEAEEAERAVIEAEKDTD